MPSHTLTMKYARDSEVLSKSVTLTNDGENNIDVSLTASQVDKQVVVGIDVSTVVSLYILADVASKLEWNNDSGAQGSITLAADQPLQWYSGCGMANPLGSTDITGFYATNLDAEAGTIKIRLLQDVTP